MSYGYDAYNITKKINELYKPLNESLRNINMDAIKSASRALEQSASAIEVLQQTHVNESLRSVANNARRMMYSSVWDNVNIPITESLQSFVEEMQPVLEKINANTVVLMDNYSDIIKEFSEIGYNISLIAEQAYEQVESDTAKEDFATNEEIINMLQEQAEDPKGFQEKIAEWSDRKKKKYYIIVAIICFIWTNFFAPYFQDTIGKPVAAYTVSKVKELPKAAGKVIDEIEEGFRAIITEDVPYYYKVTYIDKNGEIKEGYVAKKNLMVIEETEQQSIQED